MSIFACKNHACGAGARCGVSSALEKKPFRSRTVCCISKLQSSAKLSSSACGFVSSDCLLNLRRPLYLHSNVSATTANQIQRNRNHVQRSSSSSFIHRSSCCANRSDLTIRLSGTLGPTATLHSPQEQPESAPPFRIRQYSLLLVGNSASARK